MLKRNLLANYLGQGWRVLMGLAFIPLYIKYLAIEAYGLIGLYAVLQTWLGLLDMGMKPTLGREMARFMGGEHTAQSIRDLLRTIELISAGLALLVALSVWAASDWLASNWVNVETLSAHAVAQAFTVMGLVIALRFVESVYVSSIAGLQRQVLQNVVTSVMATARGLGAVAVLAWVSPSIEAFFLWQGVISLVTVVWFRTAVNQTLPSPSQPSRFSIQALREIWRFAAGMIGITVLSLLLTQVDKILLSRLLTLSEFGYYTLASLAAAATFALVSPITQAWYPRLSQLQAAANHAALVRTYHQGAQLVSVIVGSAAMVLIVFSESFLNLWTQDPDLAQRTATLLSLLVLSNLLGALMWIPYQTQLAFGWTGLALRINIVAVCIIVPAVLWVTPRYGAEGAAWVRIAMHTGYLLIGTHFMYRRILPNEKRRWYWQDVLQPLLVALSVASLVRWAVGTPAGLVAQVAELALAVGLTLTAAGIAASHVRQHARRLLIKWFSKVFCRGSSATN